MSGSRASTWGKKEIAVAVRTPGPQPGQRRQVIRKYKTFWHALLEMSGWLLKERVTHVTMEATGSTGGRCSMPCARPPTSRCCWSTRGM